uniref:Uncharacterized protein n=1 Tax=Arundo donax TaxID=35708 RepID=A0A0A9FWC5_ARUDO
MFDISTLKYILKLFPP